MSASNCVAYFGVRVDVPDEEAAALSSRSDPRLIAARKAGLKWYWDNFGTLDKRRLLFVGAQLAILGPENALEFSISGVELQNLIEVTTSKLKDAGFGQEPRVYLQWAEDD